MRVKEAGNLKGKLVRGAGCTTVAAASRQAGEDTHSGEEPVAGFGVEPGRTAEMEVVEYSRAKAIGKFAIAAVGQPEKRRVVEAAG
jgi:hypothetical protein